MIEALSRQISVIAHMHVALLRELHEERKSRHQLERQLTKLMTALGTVTDAVTQATVAQTELIDAVNAAVVRIGTPAATDAQLLTLASAIQANTESDKNLVLTLRAALGTEVPTPPVV